MAQFVWVKQLRNKLLAVNTPEIGFHVVRIVKARFDTKIERIDRIHARRYGGHERKRKGFNGKPEKILDRKYFKNDRSRGEASKGLLIRNEPKDIDLYVIVKYLKNGKIMKPKTSAGRVPRTPVPPITKERAPRTPVPNKLNDPVPFQEDAPAKVVVQADDFDPKGQIPPLKQIDTTKQDKTLLDKLAALLQKKPELLNKKGTLPNEPTWAIHCPDGTSFDVLGFGPAGSRPVKATELRIVSYVGKPGENKIRVRHEGNEMPGPDVFASIKALLKEHEKAKATVKSEQVYGAPAEVFDPDSMPLPLKRIMFKAPHDEHLVQRLNKLFKLKPELLVKSGVPNSPRWDITCPDGGVLDIGGYGPSEPQPVKAEYVNVVGYTDSKGGGFMGSSMPSGKVLKSIISLCQTHEKKATLKPIPTLDELGDIDDIFNV